jgi:hypothetical protein
VLAIEENTTINLLDEKQQKYLRQLVPNNIKKLINKPCLKREMSDNTIKVKNSREKLIFNTKIKLNQNQLIVTKSDKGNSLVILYQRDYEYINRIEEFITQNKFTKLPHNITQQKPRRKRINNSSNKINKNIK